MSMFGRNADCAESDAGSEAGSRAWIDLQIVAFPQEGILSYPNVKRCWKRRYA